MHPGRWVDERLAMLDPSGDWKPNVGLALARLRERRNAPSGRGRTWLWATVATTAATCLCLAVFPTPRALAQRCLNCSVALWQNLAVSGLGRARLTPERDRKPAPDFTSIDASGQPVKLSALRGKVVLLNFWATWCHGCKAEILWFIEFQQAYRNRDFVVLGVSRDDDGWKSVRPYINGKKVNYRVTIGDDALARQYGADQTLPVTAIIDKSGRIAATHAGVVSKNDCQAEIEALL